jgi:YD repeat-containing protein
MDGPNVYYLRHLPDGSYEVYAHSDGGYTFPRRLFLSQIVDAAGNRVTLNYDNQLRLTSIDDATGRQTTFSYELSNRPLLITRIADPFGRTSIISYDSLGRLFEITDTIGLKSRFAYDASSLVTSMTTPYGTTNFSSGTLPGFGISRFLEIRDPLVIRSGSSIYKVRRAFLARMLLFLWALRPSITRVP